MHQGVARDESRVVHHPRSRERDLIARDAEIIGQLVDLGEIDFKLKHRGHPIARRREEHGEVDQSYLPTDGLF